MKHESIALDSPIEVLDITPLNPLISKCQIKVCYVGDEPNRNGSVITKAVAREMARSLPGSPIVGYYNESTEDFETHNQIIDISNGEWKIKDTTQPYGFVDWNAKIWFQKFLDDGIEHEYLMTEGYLWTGQFPETKRIIEKGNNQSMELDEQTLQGFWSEDNKTGFSFFIINEAIISKLCILGEDVEPCFEGSQITRVQFSLDESIKEKIFDMMEQVKQIIKEDKGGNSVDNNEVLKDPEMEEKPEVATPEVQENNPEDKGEVNKYNLDEIQEYVELKSNYEELQTKYSDLENQYKTMEDEKNELLDFKNTIEKKEKQAMIDSFYMLSDEDKKDVVENIDTYSLDEIEAKLSVICVRNKVSFNVDEEEKEPSTTFSLDNDGIEDDLTPAWIKAALITKKEME